MSTSEFKVEFQRLMRAIYDSLERESELQRQLRRTKETLVSVALRLQVAVKITEEDELTIAYLQAQAADARTREIIAIRQSAEAADMVNSLTLEINLLKRRLKAVESERYGQQSASHSSLQENFFQPFETADAEVDKMFKKDLPIPLAPGTGGHPETATTFARWKMNQFLYSPDAPGGSEYHDKDVVDKLVETTSQEFFQDLRRPTVSQIAKTRNSASLNTLKMSTYEANAYEGPIEHFNTMSRQLPQLQVQHPPSSAGRGLEDEFFLDSNLHGLSNTWGVDRRFDRTNLGRLNVWSANRVLDPPGVEDGDFKSSLSKNKEVFSRHQKIENLIEKKRNHTITNSNAVASKTNNNLVKSLRRDHLSNDLKESSVGNKTKEKEKKRVSVVI